MNRLALVLVAALLPTGAAAGVCIESEGRTRDGGAWDETAADLAQRFCDADTGWQSSVKIYSDSGDGTTIEVTTFQLALVRNPKFRQIAEAYTAAVQRVLAPGRAVTLNVFPVRIGSAHAVGSWTRTADGKLTGGAR